MIPARNASPNLDSLRRRAAAEADEIALRDAHRRPRVPVHDFCPTDSLARSIFDDEERRPVAWAGLFIWLGVAVLVLIGFALGLAVGATDWRDALDFLSPTAAQARDAGWVSIAEEL
ncbi:hypothetical protein [Paracoccus sp. TOH]|uniref:hypothetical protein n=1 Tax=Paracoccus sp. TOH TaxID=1263728 RepID=UPI0025AFBB8D|nr:hypothetical protein [Paracoccus sp. TOH]WJS86730.1 hypothetical protein NBE95_19910 [Paracoccus sp. TOH]